MRGHRTASLGCVLLVVALSGCEGGDGGSAAPDAGGGSDLSVEARRAAAARASACTDGPLDYLFWALGAPEGQQAAWGLLDYHDCVLRATDCPGVLRCLGYDPDGTCEGEAGEMTCVDAHTLRSCHRVYGVKRPRDRTCQDVLGGTECVDGACSAGTCPLERPYVRCQDGVLDQCAAGVLSRVDCGAQGLVCLDGWEGCRLPGPCLDECDGDRLRLCSDFHFMRMSELDCRRLDPGLACIARGHAPGCGVPEDAETCDRARDRWCEGTDAVYCVGGFPIRVDCSFLGGRCETWRNGDGELACVLP